MTVSYLQESVQILTLKLLLKTQALTAEYTEKNGTAAANRQTDWRFYKFE